MISACIVNLNEAEKLEKCLKSLANFADEIIVIDLGSTDQTLKVCEKFAAIVDKCKLTVYKHEKVPYVELVRNFAISKANGDWVLILDPDEVLTSDLKEELKKIEKENKYDAVNIPRKNIFFGKWIRHTNWWPDKHIRFFKKGKVEWFEKIHTYPKAKGKVLELPARQDFAIVHCGYESISQFIDRQNRYSNIESQELHKIDERFSWSKFFWWPTREFLVRFIKHQGYLDGFYGFSLTFLMMVYKMMVLIKLWEKEKKGREG